MMTSVLKQIVDAASKPTIRRAKSVAPREIAQDEEGSMLVFGLILFVVMAMMGGLAIDLMRYEQRRTELQNTLDRSVLAAASLRQTLKGDAVVRDYFAKAGLTEYLTKVVPPDDKGLNAKVVSATADAVLQPFFLQMMGVDSVKIATASSASEQISNLEISLVLDISGSMDEKAYGTTETRLQRLKPAATDFVDAIFEGAVANKVTMSIVPYTAQVNVGAEMMKAFNVTKNHDASFCIELPTTTFNSIDISTTTAFTHNAHFDPWMSGRNPDFNFYRNCPPMPSSEVMVMNGAKADLKFKINNLVAKGSTSIDLGAKWGAFLLSHNSQPVIKRLADKKLVNKQFENRPLNAAGADVMKIMVLMTDGENTEEFKIKDPYNAGLSNIWRQNNDTSRISVSYVKRGVTEYYWPSDKRWHTEKRGGETNQKQLTWPEVWEDYTVSYVVNNFLTPLNSDNSTTWFGNVRSSNLSDAKNTQLQAVCTAAKVAGITIYGIGLDAPSAGRTQLRACASTPSHYYDANGTDIKAVFKTIANNIKQLRLIQ